MSVRSIAILLLVFLLPLLAPAAAEAGEFEKAAPWDRVRHVEDGVEVRVEGNWYALISIEGKQANDVVGFCKRRYGPRWKKRFAEDLVEVLVGMRVPPRDKVDLVLRDAAGKELTKTGVPMTHANRQAVRRSSDDGGAPRPAPKRDDEQFAQLAPWDGVRWEEGQPHVRVAGEWFELGRIDRVGWRSLVAFCKSRYGAKWKQRFEEDLVQVLTEMGKQPGANVDLVLIERGEGKVIDKEAVPMTKANRNAIWEAAVKRSRGEAAAATRRVVRTHADLPDPRYARLVYRVPLDSPAFEEMLTPTQAQQDLDQLEWHITNEHSYLALNNVDPGAALDTIRLGVGEGISKGDFALQLHRVICLFGDGHARIRGLSREILRPWTTALRLAPLGREVVLAAGGPRDGELPYRVVRISGVPIEQWFDAGRDIVPRGSEAYIQRRRTRDLRYQTYLRARLRIPAGTETTLDLQSLDGKRKATHVVGISARGNGMRRSPVSWEQRGEVGYLRITEMSGSRRDVAKIDLAMQAFKDTKALVIDVRGNGGGTRDILGALFPYFMRKGERHVANVAAYRIPPGVEKGAKDGYLENRFLYPATSSTWSAAERKHVTDFLASFAADLVLPEAHFSAWHAMLLTPETNPKAYRYAQRVVVLMDGGCFSATDIFLGALKGWRGVTLMGTPSGGGSGRSKRGQLAHSGIRFRLSTMASFRPTGKRYDGKGIAPDLVAEPKPEDIGTAKDSVLDRALAAAAKPVR